MCDASSLTEADKNVPLIGEHIEEYICSHKVGTFYNLHTVFTKDDKQIHLDTNEVYHYKDLTFKLKDGWLIWNDKKIELPKRTEISTFQRVAMSLGMVISLEDKDSRLDFQTISFRKLLHVFTMLALKDLKIIPNSFTQRKQYSYGVNVFEVYYKAVSTSGRIKATQKNLSWLNEQDTKKLKSKLFDNSNHSYRVGSHYMRYKPTDLAERIFARVLELLNLLEFADNKVDPKPLDFKVPNENLKIIRLRDIMLLLGQCVGYNNGFIIRPEITDYQYSRVYSVFTSISSDTRKVLGFYNYDIGAALQTICLQLVDDPSQYPLHQELMHDKKAFRAQVQDEIGKDIKWVKKELSKVNNLDSMPKKYNQYPLLKAYYQEALPLRAEIIDNAEQQILSRATKFANNKLRKIWTKGKKEPDFIEDGKKESSVFFFIWTQWERQIRESMMSCFDDPNACHQVHDAVYSRQIIDPGTIEAKVLSDTGFVVKISTD